MFIAYRDLARDPFTDYGKLFPRLWIRSKGIDPSRPFTVWQDEKNDGVWIKGKAAS